MSLLDITPIPSCARADAPPHHDPRAAVVPSDPEPVILIVDDDAAVRASMAMTLRRDGYQVREAAGPVSARPMLDGVTLCVCDVAMGEGSGLEFARDLGERFGECSIALVMITGGADREAGELALQYGAYAFMLKPFRTTELLLTVKNALLRRKVALVDRAHCDELEERVMQQTLELRASRAETVHRLAAAVELHDRDTAAHLVRVGDLSAALAARVGLSDEQCEVIRLAAWLHDIGKIAVKDEIICKPGPLTPAERREMEGHAEAGRRVLEGSQSALLQVGALIAGGHHERFDGSGYPHRLRGDAIPIEARIVAVADVYDALTSDRPYRAGLTPDAAMAHIVSERGLGFDPVIVDAFQDMTSEHERRVAPR
jgi:putative two-component system response regulator